MAYPSKAPVLPKGPDDLASPDQMRDALNKAVYDRNTGKWYYKTSDGDWVEVPLDKNGVPYQPLVLPEKAQ